MGATFGWRRVLLGSATPQRLERLRAALVVACLATAVVSALAGWARADAVGTGGTQVAAADTDAGQLYRSLNEAEAMAISGFTGAQPPPAGVVARYDDHIARATQRLTHASSLLPPGGRDAALIERMASLLPRYTAQVQEATTLRSEGSPVRDSRAREILTDASDLMRTTILPAADALRRAQDGALTDNYRRAGEFPAAVLLVGAATLLGVGYAGFRELRRTNRVVNPGLAVAGLLLVGVLGWWSIATALASDRLDAASGHNAVATALDEARITALQARASESSGDSREFVARWESVSGPGGLLDTAAGQATGETTTAGIAGIRAAATDWRLAVSQADPEASRSAFDRLGAALADVIGTERTALAGDVRGADAALGGTAGTPAVLAVLAAASAAFGIGRRIKEYR
ncbi:hypothetical protein [Pseudonocardia adelaidensis]|uniref:Secreted protein n=1 Tax=Pseudonocardia adelaidensis TaxID=648754 RepID=A0ABP9NTX7_9PSEU